MTAGEGVRDDSVEDLFEHAPCGYLATDPGGRILRVNHTLERLTGFGRSELLAGRRFRDLLSVGGRIYYETHLAPLLRMQGSVYEVALELVCADGSRLPVLINSSARTNAAGEVETIRTTVFGAGDRRSYEDELLRAQRREHQIAVELQRSLLSGAVPRDDHLQVEVAYSASERGTEVGGDWYDAFWLDRAEKRVALVVGDVVGRGLHAAAAMGQLRSAVRAIAATGRGPGDLLDSLDRYVRQHEVGQMTTLVYAELAVDSRTLSYACAGHPPPLVLEPGRRPSLLWEGRSTPMDSIGPADLPRQQAQASLSAGSTVVLYTDGLIDHQSRRAEDGLEALLALAETSAELDPAQIISDLSIALRDPQDPDDVCLLAARLG